MDGHSQVQFELKLKKDRAIRNCRSSGPTGGDWCKNHAMETDKTYYTISAS
jgi:hypothetical protein